MTTATGKQFPVGLRYGAAFALNSSGLPNATSVTVPYEGVQFFGADAFDLNVPDAKQIVHPGDDRVAAVDYLPATEPTTGTLNVSRYDMTLNALLSGVKEWTATTAGEMDAMSWGTDLMGSEPSVALFLYQQSLSGVTKNRNWRSFIIPSARCIPKPGGMTGDQINMTYQIGMNPVTSHLWGKALTTAIEGATEETFAEFQSEGRPWLASWVGNGTAVKFNYSANHQATTTATKAKVWVNGVDVTATATPAADSMTCVAAPAAGAIVVVLYELA